MANYVKFMRGTPAAYLMAEKNEDTIYFISEESSNTGELYIGAKKVATGVAEGEIASKLSELSDVDLSGGLIDGQILAWNATHAKWKPIMLNPFTGATAEFDGESGLVKAPKAGDHNKFLKGDGTWAELPSLAGLTYKIVDSIDDIDTSAEDANKYIYLVKNGEVYDEYLIIEGVVELIGNSKVDLSDYLKTSDYETDIVDRLNNYVKTINYTEAMTEVDGRLSNLEDTVSWKTL